MEEKEIKQESLKLMETADTAYLATVDGDGFPQVRAMGNLRNKEQYPALSGMFEGHESDFLIYITTDTASGKFAQIKANPKVSVYFCDSKKIKGLLLIGQIELVTDKEVKKQLWQDGWEMYYPGGVDGDEYNIFRLLPMYVKCWFMPMPKPVEFKLS